MSYPGSGIQRTLLALFICFSAGCVTVDSDPRAEPQRQTSKPYSVAPAGGVTIDSLRLAFVLPPSFQVAEDPGLLFLARSISYHAILSVQQEAPSIIDHDPEPGESLAPAHIEGVDGVIVKDAVLEGGLSPELTANQLFVSNGSHSFSVILSATNKHHSSLWEEFITSVRVITPLTPVLAQKVSSICADAQAQHGALPPLPDSPTFQQRARKVEQAAAIFEVTVARLRRVLDPGQHGSYDRWLEDWREYLKVGPRFADALRTGNPAIYEPAGNAGDKLYAMINNFSRFQDMSACIF